MDLRKLIRKKREGKALEAEEIRDFIHGTVRGDCLELQITALLMAIVHRGMNLEETVALTREMARHSERIPKNRRRPRVGKHSTGGVGDKTTFLLGPLVAHYGVEASFMAGRGLGHTGGTIDKLTGIPGLKTMLTPAQVAKILRRSGFCIFEQSPRLVPADRILYSLRDASATVESIPLLVSSILSKKWVEGLDGLVLDVKFGSGSFLGPMAKARLLGRTLLQTAKCLGLRVRVVYSSMEQPLGMMVGNSLEILECLEALRGQGPRDLVDLTVKLAEEMLRLVLPSRRVPKPAELRHLLTDGSLVEAFWNYLERQGGRLSAASALQIAPEIIQYKSSRSGWIKKIDAKRIGEICMELGAGRKALGKKIDPSVGIALLKKVGDRVRRGEVVAEVFGGKGLSKRKILAELEESWQFSGRRIRAPRLIAGTEG